MSKPSRSICLVACMILGGGHRSAQSQTAINSLISDPDAVPAVHEICREPRLFAPDLLKIRNAMTRCLSQGATLVEQTACKVLQGLELVSHGSREAGFETLQEALATFEGTEDLLGASLTHFVMGGSHRGMDEGVEAEGHFRQALELLESLQEARNSTPTRSLLLFAEILGAEEEALRQIELSPQSVAQNLLPMVRTLLSYLTGVSVACQTRFEEAEEPLRQALDIVRSRPDLFVDNLVYGLIHEHLGWIYLKLWRVEDAIRSYQSALKMAHLRNSLEIEYLANYRLSQIYGSTGQLEAALDANRKAIQAVGFAPLEQARLHVERAALLARAGRLVESRQSVADARAVASKVEGPLAQAHVLYSAGKRLLRLGYFEDAASCLNESAELLREEGGDERSGRLQEGTSLLLILAYDGLGLYQQLDSELERLRRLVAESGHQEIFEAVEFFEAGRAARKPGASDEDRERYLEMLSRFREGAKDWDHMAPSEKEDFDKAMAFVERVLQIEDPEQISAVMVSLGEEAAIVADPLGRAMKHFDSGRVEKSIRELEKMASTILANTRPPRLEEIQLRMFKALTATMRGKLELAAAGAREAMDLFESYVEGMRVDEAMTALLDRLFREDRGGSNFFQQAVEIFARVDAREAFIYAEKGRAWALRRLLGSERRNGPDTKIARREDELLDEISTLQRDLAVAAEPAASRLREELEKRLEEYEAVRLRRKLTTADETPLAQIEPIDVDRLQREVLDPDSTLLTYFYSFGRLRIWVIDRERLEMTERPLTEEGWSRMACQAEALRWRGSPPKARDAASARGATLLSGCETGDDPAEELYRQLIAPVASFLGKSRLIVVPQGALHHLPFAALRRPDTGRYLAQDFTISSVPSASSLEQLSERQSAAGEPLVLGDPVTHLEPLTGARREARRVARLLETEPYLGELATESRLYESAGRIRLLHLAAHGEYLPASPRFSRLFLTPEGMHDGALEMHEVRERLDLRGTDLVVLSGCQTGLGDVSPSDAILGLPHAFLVAGSRTVISTLWPVDDEASARLMEEFYDRFLDGSATAAEALRAAQLGMLGHASFSAPYYWAGFTLTGDSRIRWHRLPRPAPVRLARSSTPPTSSPSTARPSLPSAPEWEVRPSPPSSSPKARIATTEVPDRDYAPSREEELDELDQRFHDSLAELDRQLLREKAVKTEVKAEGGTGARGSQGGEVRLPDDRRSADRGFVRTGGTMTASDPESGSRNIQARIPPDIPDGEDDDVVARQLREAAIEEDDPELSERLWNEYRIYKGIRRAGDNGGQKTDQASKEGGSDGKDG